MKLDLEERKTKKLKGSIIKEVTLKNVILIVGIVVASLLSIASAVILGSMIDMISKARGFSNQIVIALVLLVVTTLLAALANLTLTQYMPIKVGIGKSVEFSRRVMTGLLKLSQKNYQANEKGHYINLVTSSAFTCGDLYAQSSIELISRVICVVLLINVVAYINIYFAIVFLVYIPIYAVLIKKPSTAIASFQKVGLPTQDAYLSETKRIVEDKRSINIARADEFYAKRYEDKSGKFKAFVTKFRWYSILATNMPNVLSSVLIVVTIAVSAKLYFANMATLGTMVMMIQLAQFVQMPLNRCFEIQIYRSMNTVHVDRLEDFFAKQDETSGFEKLRQQQDALATVNNAKFYTTSDKDKKLFDVDGLTIHKHSLTIIKGANGSGKSMLVNYLTGFSDVDAFEGQISLDESLGTVAYLSSPILVVGGDLNDNMFGKPIDKEVYDMLHVTFDNKEINDSVVNLSFGEQQKLNLLRVLSSDASVVILDEPFTNLDRETIERLTVYIGKIRNEKSIIAITHSPELDQMADAVWEIQGDKLVCVK